MASFDNHPARWLASYRAAITFDELEDILERSNLEGYDHVEPVFFNFWQIALLSQTLNQHRPTMSDLPRLWQKRDHFLLKTFFGNRL